MRLTPYVAALAAASLAPALAQCPNPASGPDVIVGEIPSISNYGATSAGLAGYSLGTTSCNTGQAELLWIASTNQHPVIGQNIYRLEDGRFEQIGISWLKHGFTALQGNVCCSCNSSGTGSRLGVGCSDPYGSGLNGSQSGLGPRYQVNAYTGAFSYPYASQGSTGDRAYKRIQVANDDVDPALHPNATYFGEAQYITPDDAAAGNGANNVSWRPLNRPGSTTNGAWRLSITGSTQREQPALYAWAANDPGVVLTDVMVPGEGQFLVGSNVIDNLDGTWRYEYAIFNNNSDLSGGSFSIQVGNSATIFDIGMSHPMYHSGEPYTNVAWDASVTGGTVTWQTHETYAQNQNANALRWGTMYSYWFTAATPPVTTTAVLGLFKPGGPGDQTFQTQGPQPVGPGGVIVTTYCSANVNSTLVPTEIDAPAVDMTARTMTLEASNMPLNQFGFFVTSLDMAFVPNAGGTSAGNLCLGGEIGRSVGGAILNSGATGSFSIGVDLDVIPTPMGSTSVMAGETRYFQAWHRDQSALGTATSNFSKGLRVIFP